MSMQDSAGPEYLDDIDDMEEPTMEEEYEARVMALESGMWEAHYLGLNKEYEVLKAALEEQHALYPSQHPT